MILAASLTVLAVVCAVDWPSVDVCLEPDRRTAYGRVLKYCESIERVIVSCYNASGATYFGAAVYDYVPELVPGTATVSVSGRECAATVLAIADRGVKKLVVITDQRQNLSVDQIVLRVKGEVFESHSCPTTDMSQITAFRALSSDRQCHWLHFLQLSKFLYDTYPSAARERFRALLARRPTHAEAQAIVATKRHFAAFGFGKFRLNVYHGDYVVRHAFVELLRRRNIGEIHALGGFSGQKFSRRSCPGTFTEMHTCLQPYRFAIVMENSNFPGYVSEKLLNAFLAQAVPIYFGAEDVSTYFNEHAMIVCRITAEETVVLRAAHRNNYPMLAQKTDAAIVEWAISTVEHSLRSCIDQAVRLANDSDAYLRMLTAHPLAQLRAERTYIDGYDASCQLVRILQVARPHFFADNYTRSACQAVLATQDS